MQKKQMVRLVEFDRLVRNKCYPNINRFSRDYEVSKRTAMRDLDFLREDLGAPLAYHSTKKGYYYKEEWTLPTILSISNLKEDRLSLVVAQLSDLSYSDFVWVIKTSQARWVRDNRGESPFQFQTAAMLGL